MQLNLNLTIICSALGHVALMASIMWLGDPSRNPAPQPDPLAALPSVTREAPPLAILYIPPPPRPPEVSSRGNATAGDAALDKVRADEPPKVEPPKAEPPKPVKKRRPAPALAKKTPPKAEPPRPEPPKVEPPRPDREVAAVVTTPEASKATAAAAAPPVVAAAPVTDGQTIGSAQADASSAPATSPNEATSAGSSNPSRAGARDGDADLTALRKGYRKQVFHQLNRDKAYPVMARRARMEGKVVLGIHIDNAGRILKVEVVRSSGHQLLDREAQLAVQRLGKLPSPPESLGWDRKVLRVPMIYRLT